MTGFLVGCGEGFRVNVRVVWGVGCLAGFEVGKGEGTNNGVFVGNKVLGVGASLAHSTETRSLKDMGIPSQVESSTFPRVKISKYLIRLVGSVSK